jgi:hypothetical protein
MPDMLATGLAFLTDQLAKYASQPVTIVRGVEMTNDVPATFGNKLLKLDDGFGGIRMEWTDLDLLIPAVDYAFSNVQVPPERGDLAILMIGHQIETFEVFPFGNEAPWRWADPHQSMLRIHYKYVNEESIGQ